MLVVGQHKARDAGRLRTTVANKAAGRWLAAAMDAAARAPADLRHKATLKAVGDVVANKAAAGEEELWMGGRIGVHRQSKETVDSREEAPSMNNAVDLRGTLPKSGGRGPRGASVMDSRG